MASFDWASLPGLSWIAEAFNRIGMDHAQWGYTIFDAGSYGYSSVTSHTLAPLVYARRAAAQAAAAQASAAAAAAAQTSGTTALAADKGIFMGSDITAYWVFMISTASLLAGLLCPIFGTIADLYGIRKIMTYISALLSIIFLTIFAYCTSSVSIHWLLFYAGTAITFSSLSHAFYNSLIMLVTGPEELVKVACIQASVGSLGAAVLMTALGLHNTEDLNRNFTLFAFGIAALWFILLALPMWFWFKEDPPSKESTWQVGATAASIQQYLLDKRVERGKERAEKRDGGFRRGYCLKMHAIPRKFLRVLNRA
jgi:MFS-type transporter involved in bile tolerance (Atg22 family)